MKFTNTEKYHLSGVEELGMNDEIIAKAFGGQIVELTMEGSDEIVYALPPFFGRIFEESYSHKDRMDLIVAMRLLPHADISILEEQVQDFENLDLDKLTILASVNELPLEAPQRGVVNQILGNGYLSRLERRYEQSESKYAEEK